MTPPVIANAGPLLSRYDAIFCDVWGVVHNGQRAYAETGRKDEARKAYQAFFDFWKNADPEIPLLVEARAEFAKLTGS